MNNNRWLTALGLISGVSELIARSGVLGDQSVIADGIFSVSVALMGFLAQGRDDAPQSAD